MRIKNIIEQMVCLVFLFGTTTHMYAENGSGFIPTNFQGYYFSPQNLGFATAQTAEFVQYGNIGMNLYNGLLDLNIPLFDYKDPAFELNASIQYLSDGFKPGRRPSVVGNNWILNIGGSITRNVVGTPDDVRQNQNSGLLAAIRDGQFKQYSKEDLFNIKVAFATQNRLYAETEYDMSPDIFDFNFGRHKGRFIIDNAGNAKCLSGGGYKINLSEMAVQDYTTTDAPKYSLIQITTPDGYLYSFGGTTSCLEYSVPNNPSKLKKKPVQITSWYLSSIKNIARNRTVFFNYQSYLQKNKYHLFIRSYSSGVQWTHYKPDNTGYTKPSESSSINDGDTDHFVLEDKIYTPVLQRIGIDDTEIKFTVGTFPVNFFGEPDGNDLLYLSGITMTTKSGLVKSCAFNYDIKGRYFFLKKATIHDQSENPSCYDFYYNLNNELPEPLTTSVDHWGFWNGGYEIINDTNTFFFDGQFNTRKAVNTNVAGCAMLSKIIYPTRGEERVDYEYNRYRFYLTKSINAFAWNSNETTYDTPCGGVRIGKLTMYDPITRKERQRSFKYINPDTGMESGRLNELPRYSMPEENIKIDDISYDHTITSLFDVYSISSNCIGRLNNISEYPVGYSHVTETFDDGSYSRYHYSSLVDIPDNPELGCGFSSEKVTYRSFNGYQKLDKALNYTPNDLSAFRGKLLSKCIYNNHHKKVAMEEYEYNFEDRTSDHEVSISTGTGMFVSNKIFTTPCLLTYEKLTDENDVAMTHHYEYNAKGFVSQKEIVNSNGNHVYLKYIYSGEPARLFPDEYSSGLSAINRIEEPVALIKYIRKAGESERRIVGGIQYLYKTFSGCGIQKRSLLTFKMPESLPEDTNFGDGKYLLNYTEGIESYDNYDEYGNFITYRSNKETTVYLWSYSGRYMMAEIRGATYDLVKAALGRTPESLSRDNYIDKKELEKLRELLPQAHITIYDYEPQVGVKYMSEPTGRVSGFHFDNQGRLSKTYRTGEDGELQLTEYNTYHYTEQ